MTKKKGGRPRIELTPEQLAKIPEMAADGMTIKQIANYFRISESTFKRRKQENNELLTLYEKGEAEGIREGCGILKQRIREGDVTSLIFFLKAKAGWSTAEKKQGAFKVGKEKKPLDVVDTALDALSKGEISVKEASLIAGLAMTKSNIEANTSPLEQQARIESREELMEQVYAINRALDHVQSKKKEVNA